MIKHEKCLERQNESVGSINLGASRLEAAPSPLRPSGLSLCPSLARPQGLRGGGAGRSPAPPHL